MKRMSESWHNYPTVTHLACLTVTLAEEEVNQQGPWHRPLGVALGRLVYEHSERLRLHWHER